jgi:hypothetical protein
MTLKNKLILAASAYDRRRANKPGYNIYALAQYFTRIDEVLADIDAGASPRAALLAAFSDRLLDALLVGIGEPKHTRAEKDAVRGGWAYQPVAARSV